MSTGDPWCKVHGFTPCGCAETAKLPTVGVIEYNPGDKVFLLAEREALLKDAERLSWLQKQLDKKSYTGKCVFRWSVTGRGWRLHEVSDLIELSGLKAVDSVREAIDQAMRDENESHSGRIEGDSGQTDSGSSAETRAV